MSNYDLLVDENARLCAQLAVADAGLLGFTVEVNALRAQLATVTAERDEARAETDERRVQASMALYDRDEARAERDAYCEVVEAARAWGVASANYPGLNGTAEEWNAYEAGVDKAAYVLEQLVDALPKEQ